MTAAPQTNQSAKQASVRLVTGSAESYEGDWHRLFDLAAIAANDTFNGRLLRWLNLKLSASYTNLPEAMQALATSLGVFNWDSIGTFDASTGGGGSANAQLVLNSPAKTGFTYLIGWY